MNGTGGHSGSTIHLNTVNTIVEFFNILKIVSGKYQLRIIDIKSTTQLNAIPPYCDVTISIKRNQVNHFKKLFLTQFNNLVNAYKSTEKNLTLVITNVKSTKEPLTINDTNKLINLILSANNGLNNYDSTFNIPSVSTNLGKVILNDSEAQVGWLQRSNNEYNLNKLNNKLSSLFELVNGSGKAVNLTEGLNTNVNNRLALQVQKIAQNALNHPTILLPTHAVLEIGDIARHYPEITCISIGPDIQYAHTPKECVEINSMLYIYQLLKEILKSIR
jgi:dipeptidase D